MRAKELTVIIKKNKMVYTNTKNEHSSFIRCGFNNFLKTDVDCLIVIGKSFQCMFVRICVECPVTGPRMGKRIGEVERLIWRLR